MTRFTGVRATRARRRRSTGTLAAFARPVLRAGFGLYLREVRGGVGPRDLPRRLIDGPDPRRLLFFGDVAVAGYGVLSHDLTVAARTAAFVAGQTGLGCRWDTVSAPDLTASRLAGGRFAEVVGADVVLLLLGIPDALLGTPADTWGSDLARVVESLRREAGEGLRILVAGMPPITAFRPIPSVVRKMIGAQVHRLNTASAHVVGDLRGVDFVPFPVDRVEAMYIDRQFSWRTMHETWARTLARAITG